MLCFVFRFTVILFLNKKKIFILVNNFDLNIIDWSNTFHFLKVLAGINDFKWAIEWKSIVN